MKTLKSGPNSFVIEFSQEELGLINNALNEVCNGIEISEFQTRLGSPIERIRELLQNINNELKNWPRQNIWKIRHISPNGADYGKPRATPWVARN